MAVRKRKQPSYKQPQVYDSSFKDWISQQADDILPLLVPEVDIAYSADRNLECEKLYGGDCSSTVACIYGLSLRVLNTESFPSERSPSCIRRCDMYQYKDHKEAIESLRKAGFNHMQMDKIVKFRRNFALGEMDKTPTERRRLEFARWLFLHGKLNETGEQQ